MAEITLSIDFSRVRTVYLTTELTRCVSPESVNHSAMYYETNRTLALAKASPKSAQQSGDFLNFISRSNRRQCKLNIELFPPRDGCSARKSSYIFY